MQRVAMFSLAALCLVLLPRRSVAQTSPELLVVNQFDRTLSVLDPATGKNLATIPVGGVTGHEVAVSPDGLTAFVPIYGNSGVGQPGTDGSSVAVIDLPSRKLRGSVQFPHGVRPHSAVYDPRRRVLYVTSELDHTVSVIDPQTLRLIAAIPTGQPESHMLALSHSGRRAYTANVAPGTVSVLDLDTGKTVAILPIASNVQRISTATDDSAVFTSDQASPRLAVISTATNQVTHWIPLPGIGYGSAPTRDGRYLLVALWQTDQVAVIDLRKSSVIRTLTVGHGPVEILLRPDGETAYVSSPSDAAVTEISLHGEPSTWHTTRTLKAGAGSDGMAWAAHP